LTLIKGMNKKKHTHSSHLLVECWSKRYPCWLEY